MNNKAMIYQAASNARNVRIRFLNALILQFVGFAVAGCAGIGVEQMHAYNGLVAKGGGNKFEETPVTSVSRKDRFYVITHLNWDETKGDAGIHSAKWQWYLGDKLVAERNKDFHLEHTPFRMWWSFPAADFEAGHYRVKVILDDKVIDTQEFDITDSAEQQFTAPTPPTVDGAMETPSQQDRWTPAVPFPAPDKVKLQGLLANRQFDELESLLELLRVQLINDPGHWDSGYDWLLTRSYMAISGTSQQNQADLKLWLEAHPASSEAHIAFAFMNLNLGVIARGSKWAKDTPRDQIESMKAFFATAKEHARKALELQPNNPMPYRALIRVAPYEKLPALLAIGNEALAKYPYSYLLRVHFMEGLRPRWDGNYVAMLSFAETSQQFSQVNPQMRVLLGFPYWARGQDYESAGDDKSAYQQYIEALKFGDEGDFYEDLIKLERRTGMTQEAARDAEVYNRLFPR